MKKRDTLMALLALGAAPFATRAQQPGKVWRIGYLGQGSGPNLSDQAFREELTRLGYIDGRNLQIEYRWAGGIERLNDLTAELARLKVDVIMAQATGTGGRRDSSTRLRA